MRINLIYYSIYADRAGCRAKGRVKCGESRTTRVAVAKQLQTVQLAHNGLILIYYSIMLIELVAEQKVA